MKILKAAALLSLVAAECSWNEHNKEGSKEKQISAYLPNSSIKIVLISKLILQFYLILIILTSNKPKRCDDIAFSMHKTNSWVCRDCFNYRYVRFSRTNPYIFILEQNSIMQILLGGGPTRTSSISPSTSPSVSSLQRIQSRMQCFTVPRQLGNKHTSSTSKLISILATIESTLISVS